MTMWEGFEAPVPQLWVKTNDFRQYYTKIAELNKPNPKLQQMWQGSRGAQRWEDVEIVIEE